MRTNQVKTALEEGRPQIGTWLTLGNVLAARLLARMGFTWLAVDIEHYPIDWSELAVLSAAVADAGCTPLARVPRGDHDHIKRALDAGAAGVIVPMVNTVDEARLAIAATKYPPAGNRSVGGAWHAPNFDTTSATYFAEANDQTLVVLQTESPQGVANAPDIYALDGVDAILVGPGDLGRNLRRADGTDAPAAELEAMLQRVLETGRRTRTPVGLQTADAAAATRRMSEGWQFIGVSSDLRMLTAEAQRVVESLLGASVR